MLIGARPTSWLQSKISFLAMLTGLSLLLNHWRLPSLLEEMLALLTPEFLFNISLIAILPMLAALVAGPLVPGNFSKRPDMLLQIVIPTSSTWAQRDNAWLLGISHPFRSLIPNSEADNM
jgi:hypothetical protein